MDIVGDILEDHRLEECGTIFKESSLTLDNRTHHKFNRREAVIDRLDEIRRLRKLRLHVFLILLGR